MKTTLNFKLMSQPLNPLSRSIALALCTPYLLAQAAVAETLESKTAAFEPPELEEVFITGGKEALQRLAGSAQLIDEAQLEAFDSIDLNEVLAQLPGVYLRQEDGFGLRPNIGIRGANSDRSQKITLMEDGVLITPAPYSAPAAYYIPNVSRMQALEVVKGPSAILHGPHTVGGALNLVTQSVGSETAGFVDASVGNFSTQKYQAFFNQPLGEKGSGFWVDGLHYRSDGFKTLDGFEDASTGFERSDINTKWQWALPAEGDREHWLTLKLGYADETSNETYLGLTPTDFEQDPYRRYAASQLDQFNSEHSQAHLDHKIALSDALSIRNQVYWNRFDRSWNKLDGFIGGLNINTVLSTELFPRALAVLRGEVDSNGQPNETIDVTNNDRAYESYGWQWQAAYEFETSAIEHRLLSGLRWHHDEVTRRHSTLGYGMVSGVMVNDGEDYGFKQRNQADSDALSMYIQDTMSWKQLEFNVGIRYENIDGTFLDQNLEDLNQNIENTADLENTEVERSNQQEIVIPGVGVFWQATENIGFLAGVNKGFSPAGPGADDSVEPEESINYEYGVRFQHELGNASVIGFFSDYSNLLGRCGNSDANTCTPGQDEFNGGAVEIAGVEVTADTNISISKTLSMPLAMNYTYSESAFQTAFESQFSLWGDVNVGDPLPYLPEHIGRVQIGLQSANWDIMLAVKYQGEMRDNGYQGRGLQFTDELTTLHLSSSWVIDNAWTLQVIADNLTDETGVVSYRPFGQRPNAPRMIRGRVKYAF